MVRLTVGDISDQTVINNRKQERRARMMAYNMCLPLLHIVKAYEAHCRNSYEFSEFLDIAEDNYP